MNFRFWKHRCLAIQQNLRAARPIASFAVLSVATMAASAGAHAIAQESGVQEADAPVAETAKEETVKSSDKNAGQSDLDAAIDAKLDADNLEALDKVMDLAQKAIDKGLDEGNQAFAKQLIGAAAFDKAKRMVEEAAASRLGARGFSRLQNEVTAMLKLATENDPKLADAHILLARMHATNKDAAAARESLTKALETLEDDRIKASEVYLLRALVTEGPEEQAADLEKATTLNPQNQAAWQARLQLAVIDDDKDKAHEIIKGFLGTGSDNMVAIQGAIEALLLIDKTDDAISYLDEKIETTTDKFELYRLRAQSRLGLLREFLFKPNSDEAKAEREEISKQILDDASRAIELNPQDVPSYLLRAQTYLILDPPNLDEANKDVDEALALQPGSIMGLKLRSDISAQLKQYAEAIADMELLVRDQPTNPGLLLQLAQLYQADDRPSLAIKAAEQVIKLDAEIWQAYRIRGDAYLSVGQQKDAVEDYEAALKIIKDDEEKSGLLNNLAWVLATSPQDEIRNGKRSLELALEACEITDYKESHILSTLGAAYAESGDFEKAREWSKKAVEKGREDEVEQLDQLEAELKSYEENKPWRELQETEEVEKPIVQIEEGIDA